MKKYVLAVCVILATTGVCFADDYIRQMESMRYQQQQRSIQADINRQNEFNRLNAEIRQNQMQSEINIMRSRQSDPIQSTPPIGLPRLPGLPSLLQ